MSPTACRRRWRGRSITSSPKASSALPTSTPPSTSSVGFGHTLGKTIALGYLPTDATAHSHFTIEAFGRALPALAAATKVWRDLFPTPDEVWQKGITFINDSWAKA